MQKDNIFKSSQFHMDIDDVLHILIIEESGTPVTINLVNTETPTVNEGGTPSPAVTTAATSVFYNSFSANWDASTLATGYYLDVSTSIAFTSFVGAYNNKDVGNVTTYSITGLSASTPYYYRVRAYNTIGTAGNSNATTTTTGDAVVDADGNNYTFVTIGTQDWLVENFRSTKYADGTAIPNLTLNADWLAEDGTIGHDGAYCYYDNNIANKADYGALYNWYAVGNAHGFAPVGWRVPTLADFEVLATFISPQVGGSLKEVGLSHWTTPNTGATDLFGFKALGSGRRLDTGVFQLLNIIFHIWNSDGVSVSTANNVSLVYDSNSAIIGAEDKKLGCSVRLMRDTP